MAAKLPHVLVDMNAFLRDESYAGLINKMTLPKIIVKTAEKAMSGVAGAVERSLGRLEKMESEVTIEAFHPTVIGLPGSNASRDELIIVRGALDVDGGVVPLVVRFSGLWKDLDLGEINPEKEVEVKSNVAIEHFELEVDGRELIYVDKLTNVWRMNGRDMTKDIRAALGQ
ncbi:phage major tail tube protein [Aeromonas aquatica]|uniref:phage major tail tube protein n=1 Tax=Aeromonas aquatica TaxID=558964 RepID=UPI00051C3B7B|nr:phage major tail tube protein [Aeromonas aquatica]